MIPDADILELASHGRGWVRGGRPWTPERPFYAVIGDPVAHSLSPVFQTAALRAEGLPHDYLAIRVEADALARLRDPGAAPGLAGFNVTAPHKRAAAALCAGLSDAARRTGAVNTVRVGDDGWRGHATDPGGVLEVLREGLGGRRPETGVVLGGGGVATAALDALAEAGATRRIALARPGPGLDALAAWRDDPASDAAGVEVRAWTPGDPWPDGLAGAACVWGLPRDVRPPALPADGPAFWLDMNYGPGIAPPDGLPAGSFRDGLPVLLAQGALSFAWWFDRPAPRAAMAAAVSAP